MIFACLNQPIMEPQEINAGNLALLKEAVWIDLLSPSKEEENQVEAALGLDVPTSEEMREIELSSRLYRYNGALVMTATMVAQSDTLNPVLDPVTFIVTEQQLFTVRYIEPQAFRLFILKLKTLGISQHNNITLFTELLDATVDRLADILELVAHRMDEYSKLIFQLTADKKTPKVDYSELIRKIGLNGELNTKARESLITFNRLITFFSETASMRIESEGKAHLTSISKDITALSDHANFLSTKVNFLLDAVLGMVNIEQNNIIKIFTVAAVMFMPPTLIASIYGMNFKVMPELSWKFGYLIAISMMVISAWLPFKYFKRRKWL